MRNSVIQWLAYALDFHSPRRVVMHKSNVRRVLFRVIYYVHAFYMSKFQPTSKDHDHRHKPP